MGSGTMVAAARPGWDGLNDACGLYSCSDPLCHVRIGFYGADTIMRMADEILPDFPEVRLAELVMPNHTNHHGTLFGGHALGLMDHAGWVAATRCARRTMVTVASDRVEFKVPVRAGQLVELVAKVTRVGRTSVTVGVDMFAEDVQTGERRLATSGSFVFVAIGDDGQPTPIDADDREGN